MILGIPFRSRPVSRFAREFRKSIFSTRYRRKKNLQRLARRLRRTTLATPPTNPLKRPAVVPRNLHQRIDNIAVLVRKSTGVNLEKARDGHCLVSNPRVQKKREKKRLFCTIIGFCVLDIVARLAQSSSESDFDPTENSMIDVPLYAEDCEIAFNEHLRAFQDTAPRHIKNRKMKKQKRKVKKDRAEGETAE